MKKTVCVILSLVMLASLFGGLAASAGAASSGQCGENVSWSLSDDGTLTISGDGHMDDYFQSNDDPAPWFGEREKITAAVVKEGVRNVGTYAFYDCQSLRTVSLAGSVTAIGKGAFRDCVRLDGAALPPQVTVIETETFANCRHLSDLTVPEGLLAVGEYAFMNCSSLTTFFISERLTEIDFYAFGGCLRLYRIDVAEGNPVYASDENGVVFNKAKTALLRYPGGRQADEYAVPEGVKEIAPYAFLCSPYLTKVTLPSSVETIGEYAFCDCPGLREPAVNDTVTGIATGTYYNCEGLSEAVIPGNVKTIGESAFGYCDRLRRVTLGDGVTSVGESAFINNKRLSYLCLPRSLQTVGESAFDGAALKTVLYAGTQEEWGRIDLDDGNGPLAAAEIRCQADPAEMRQLDRTVYLIGDVTGDLDVSAEDARLALRASVKLEDYGEGSREYLSADADRDGELTAEDARLILRTSVKLETLDDGGMQPFLKLGFSDLRYSTEFLTGNYYNSAVAVFDGPYDDFIKANGLPEDAVAIDLIDPEGSLIGTEARIGDIVVGVNGKSVSDIDEFVAGGKAGDPVTLSLVRIREDGTAETLEVTATVMMFAD